MSVTAIKDSFNQLEQKWHHCADSAIAALSKAVTTEATVICNGEKLRLPSLAPRRNSNCLSRASQSCRGFPAAKPLRKVYLLVTGGTPANQNSVFFPK